jgi:hypothetical protein
MSFVTEIFWYRKGDLLDFKAGHDFIAGFSKADLEHLSDSIGIVEENIKERLHDCLKQVETIFSPGDNDLEYVEYEFPPYNIYVAGGEEERPPELLNEISDLNNAEIKGRNILEACGLNPETIDYREILMKILRTKELIPLLLGIDKNLDTLIEKEILKHGKRKKSNRRKR